MPETSEPARAAPLRAVVTVAMVGLIVLATGAVALTTYLSSRDSVDGLWRALATNVGDHAARETRRFLDPAQPFTQMTAAAMRGGRLDPSDDEAVLAWMQMALEANPSFTWASFGRADGAYLAVYRFPVEGKPGQEGVRRTWRTLVEPGEASGDPKAPMAMTRLVDHVRDDDGSWRPLPEERRRYDPRRRPWYRNALAAGDAGGAWSDPYIFLSRHQPGVAWSSAVRGGSGALVGVLAAEFEASPLSHFVASLSVGRSGRVYVLTNEGEVVAHPQGETVRRAGDQVVVHHADEHPDPMLRAAWRALGERGGDARWQPLVVGPYLAMAHPLQGVPWQSLTVVPADDFYGELTAQAQRSLLIALVVALLAVVVATALSRNLIRAVHRVSEQMLRLARFDLDSDESAERSKIRELAQMGRAADHLRQGLRSFSRYVPYQLVRQLLAGGREARLGGEIAELTVLFSDIAGFTPVVERTPPDVVVEALGEYLQKMNEAIGATNGTVCQYLGDAIMAFWGAPDPQVDHALRACRSALAMSAAARELVARAEHSGRPALPTRFGLNTGEVMVGNIGAPERFNYAIVGDSVNAAARLEGLNKVYGTSILVGERTAALVGEALVLRQLDWVRMKGKARAMAVYELVGERDSLDESEQLALQRYGEGLALYRQRDFEAAAKRFTEASELGGRGDSAAQVMGQRCENYRVEPPPDDWDGSLVMQTK